MTAKISSILLFVSLFVFISCTKKSQISPSSAEAVLKSNAWKVDRIVDIGSGLAIPPSILPAEATALFAVDIQFKENNKTVAIDRVSKQPINGGTWFLLDQNQTLDIDVSQLKGKFPLKELSNSKMILNYKIKAFGGDYNVFLELVPSI